MALSENNPNDIEGKVKKYKLKNLNKAVVYSERTKQGKLRKTATWLKRHRPKPTGTT